MRVLVTDAHYKHTLGQKTNGHLKSPEMNIPANTSRSPANRTWRPLRLIFAHDGIARYDRLFLKRFAQEFVPYLVTFTTPTEVEPYGVQTHIVRLPDFGKAIAFRRINRLRIVVGTLWRIIQLRRCLNSIRPDLVIANWVTTYGLYASICRWRPFVLFVYGSDVLVDPYRSLLHLFVTQMVLRSADLILVDSKVQKEAVLLLGASRDKIISFPWVNLNDLRDVSADSGLRKRLGWEGKTVIISARAHEPHYSVATLIRAIPSIVSQFPNARFLIFGNGTQTATLVKLVRELDVETYVHFAGMVPRPNLLRYMKNCDIYVSTSLTDGCSSTLLEAMYFELPVIVTPIPGNTEWVSDSVNGLFFDREDPSALARAVLHLLKNPKDAERLAHRAAELVRERVDWEAATGELITKMTHLQNKANTTKE